MPVPTTTSTTTTTTTTTTPLNADVDVPAINLTYTDKDMKPTSPPCRWTHHHIICIVIGFCIGSCFYTVFWRSVDFAVVLIKQVQCYAKSPIFPDYMSTAFSYVSTNPIYATRASAFPAPIVTYLPIKASTEV